MSVPHAGALKNIISFTVGGDKAVFWLGFVIKRNIGIPTRGNEEKKKKRSGRLIESR